MDPHVTIFSLIHCMQNVYSSFKTQALTSLTSFNPPESSSFPLLSHIWTFFCYYTHHPESPLFACLSICNIKLWTPFGGKEYVLYIFLSWAQYLLHRSCSMKLVKQNRMRLSLLGGKAAMLGTLGERMVSKKDMGFSHHQSGGEDYMELLHTRDASACSNYALKGSSRCTRD